MKMGKLGFVTMIASFFIVIMIALTFAFRMQSNPKESTMKYYGHRGYSSEYPQNTLPAFDNAMKEGFDGVELDVYETSSGDLMVFHDFSLKKLCGVDLTIRDVSKDNREAYPVTGGANIKNFQELLIPTLEEVVEAMGKCEGFMYIHIKKPADFSMEGIAKVKSILAKYEMMDQSIIFCGDIDTLNKFHDAGLTIAKNKTTTNELSVDQFIDECIKQKIKTIIIFYPDDVTEEVVKKCHDNDARIGVYNVKTTSEGNRLEKMGVDFVFTNYALMSPN